MSVRLSNKIRSIFVLSDRKYMVLLALAIGVADGGAAAILIRLTNHISAVMDVQSYGRILPLASMIKVFIPAIGGLLAGWVIGLFHHEAEKTGVPQVVYALRKHNGHIPERLTITKAVASALTVGSGGSVGPEAPVALIGGGVGSMFAHLRHLSHDDRKVLVAAGAAGGLAAVFNTPIAAVIFALEVLLSEFASGTFAILVLTTVTASVSSHLLLGERTYFPLMSYVFNSPTELWNYFLLGIVCAPVAKIFQWTYLRLEDLFDGWKGISRPVKTMLGGLGVGLIAIVIPQVISDGHLVVTDMLTKGGMYQWSIGFLILLLGAKILATSLTVASGGSGGTMVPAMYIGAMTGVAFGHCVQQVSHRAAGPGAYGMVGMAAVLAGITHAPFTAIMMLFELTGDYKIILPLMFTVGVTMLIASWLKAEHMEYRELHRRGVKVHAKAELRVLEKYRVQEVMSTKVESIPRTLSLAKLTEFIARSPHTGYPVVDEANRVVGVITYLEMHQAFSAGELPGNGVVASDIMRTEFPIAFPEESLADAVQRMQRDKADRILVVDPGDQSRLRGILTKGDILSIYRSLVA
jgi:CIC family chloride channel protein